MKEVNSIRLEIEIVKQSKFNDLIDNNKQKFDIEEKLIKLQFLESPP